MYYFWDGQGAVDYIQRNGFNDPALLNFALALSVQWDVHSIPEEEHVDFESGSPAFYSCLFIEAMFYSLRMHVQDVLDEPFDDDSMMGIWVHVFKLHCAVRSSDDRSWLERNYRSSVKTWKELCRDSLPHPDHAKLFEELLRLEDVHGLAARKRFRMAH
ncbi:hypothetical protein SCHPADRAFT_318793 [Schizopora paradoxa]|uniref:Uncharacterized protein n=1 Tax=Schizopora paradoxa TaxID=27342 RepID=A0A0H2RXT8_9AGAM|nr:hypothetical protein SCHPADRAFT_318793 [Schizopora paradoxa]